MFINLFKIQDDNCDIKYKVFFLEWGNFIQLNLLWAITWVGNIVITLQITLYLGFFMFPNHEKKSHQKV